MGAAEFVLARLADDVVDVVAGAVEVALAGLGAGAALLVAGRGAGGL